MRQYAVSVIVEGRNVEIVISANSSADAIAVVKSQYGNVPIFGARIIG